MIEVSNVSKIYDNGARGLCDFDLFIEKGEFVFIVGATASGKSSLLRLLRKEIEPSDGKIIVDGQDISKIKRRQLPFYRRKMGVVFQDFRLLKDKTVFENVAFAMQIVQASTREIRRAVPQVLALVGLAKKAKAYPNQLSGGEQQRTALARAIVNKPPILIADEPTGNLDPDTAWDIMTLLQDINDRGTTVVVATHAHDIVDDMQKRVIALKNGELVRDIGVRGAEWVSRQEEELFEDDVFEEEPYDTFYEADEFVEEDFKNED
ncbi:MAG: cell division ATP-binding protein FtsE [Defluviitaleaceae bacterium]|nr:cell division ATP-binding protein FtsE [Defluviitaleaceae bacterium]